SREMIVDDATLDLPVVELTALLDNGQLTSVALTEAYLARIAKRAPALNCFITVTPERARADAAKADARRAAGERGPVLGIPYGLKDLIDTAGIATTWGTRSMLERVPKTDADVAARLAAAGGVLLGKLHCTELANSFGVENQEDAHNGACRNPWSLDRWAGGSSGGSGAAVAAGLCGFAIGSETLGSIDCPSAFCGVVGLRPTYDLVSRAGVMTAAYTLDKLGPLTRDARDARAVLPLIATQPIEAKQRRLRVGIADVIDPKLSDPALAPLFDKARSILREIADVQPVTLPEIPTMPATLTILLAEIRAAFDDFIRAGHIHALYDRQSWATKEREYLALDLRAEDYIKATRVRTQAQQVYRTLFDRFDVLLTPGRPEVARKLVGYKGAESDAPNSYTTLLVTGNLIGAPAITLPIGFSAESLPLSMHAIGSPYDDDAVLALAELYQAHTDFHRKRPPS
ncbi:MAG TPA: amidase, partial [Kofleriaceae bacterium]|nr:amidase [Kofleriaceae bacterium]